MVAEQQLAHDEQRPFRAHELQRASDARLSAAREAGMGTPRTLSVAVREKADGAHRPSWRHARRPPYVRGQRNMTIYSATR